MNDLVEIVPSFPNSNDSSEVAFVKMVKLNLIDASRAFFEIGFRLYEAQQYGYFEKLGFENIVDCAEYHFGFKKSTTYDLINIYRVFCEKTGAIFMREHWRDFNQSQLSVIASACSSFGDSVKKDYLRLFSPSDSVRKIKRATICFKAVHNFGCSHIPFSVIEGAKSADDVIQRVEDYALNDFGYVKANYPKVITPELELRCASVRPIAQENSIPILNGSDEYDENFQEAENAIENSGRSEKGLSYEDKEDFKEDFYNKFNMHLSNFLIDNCCFSTDSKTVTELAGEFILMFFEYLKENKADFEKVLKFGSFKPYDVRFVYDG